MLLYLLPHGQGGGRHLQPVVLVARQHGQHRQLPRRRGAPRVEVGEDQDSGVARSSRIGTKRKVKARPTTRSPVALEKGRGPRSQELRMPFLRRSVVSVAVVQAASAAATAGSRGAGSCGMTGSG